MVEEVLITRPVIARRAKPDEAIHNTITEIASPLAMLGLAMTDYEDL